MKQLLPIVALVLCSTASSAQTPPAAHPPTALQQCLLNTTSGTWSKLHLTGDQQNRVQRLHEACVEECTGIAAQKSLESTMTNDSGSTVIAELKNILTPEQYQTWSVECVDGAGTGPSSPPVGK